MGVVRILDERVANQIAAGEVVERPASVVKELVENSLDAGAAAIEVRIRKGGKTLVEVVDDGEGMGPEDAELCLERHATSKITSAEDLLAVRTLGFRGEALPSIAAVSEFALVTRRREAPEAVRIATAGGATRTVSAAGAPPGTTVTVKSLFFNTPARRKFLRGDETEFSHVHGVLVAAALAHQRVRFRLVREGEEVFDATPSTDALQRLGVFFADSFRRGLVPVDHESPRLKVTGFTGVPSLAKASRSGQLFFLNARPIRNPSLGAALGLAYQGLLPQGRFAAAVLFLEVDPGEVDVNVHPTKREVRFHDERRLVARLADIVREALRRADVFKDLALAEPGAFPLAAPLYAGGPLLRERPGAYSVPTQTQPGEDPQPLRGLRPALVERSPFRVLGQFRGVYVVVEVEGGLWIVDQHAAHERVMFEQVLASLADGRPQVQPFLTPPLLEVLPRERAVVEEFRDALERVGFSLSPFGPNTFQVRSMPAYFEAAEVLPLLREVIERSEEPADLGRLAGDRRTELAARVACKMKSIKAGQTLTPEAMAALVRSLLACASPFTCPHGRPTMIRLTAADLERHFDRR